ncbi:MAG TPA: Xaa-Pro peptidase family protein [Acidimicrobiia bacterium]
MSITNTEFARRHEGAKSALVEGEFDALIAYSTAKVAANVRYLTDYFVRFTGMQNMREGGYHMFGSSAVLFPTDGEPMVRTDQPWDIARAKEISMFPDTEYAGLFAQDFGRVIRERGYRRVAIDNWYIFPAREFMALQEMAPDVEFVPSHLMSELRRIKSEEELAIIRRSAALAVEAVETSLDTVQVGANEYDVVLLCEETMRRGGDIELAGGSISGCGPNTSTGSWVPSNTQSRAMAPGEWVMMDVCPRVDGYAGDISRHRVAGDVSDLDPRLKKMYDVALVMSEEVRKAIKPGVSGRELNSLAEQIADGEGFLENKIGLLGHGLGLDIHDIPDFYYDESLLSPGEVITVEPCLLLEGVGGVRIEDMVLVTGDGSETLTSAADRELRGSS